MLALVALKFIFIWVSCYLSAQNLLRLVTYFYYLKSDWWPHFLQSEPWNFLHVTRSLFRAWVRDYYKSMIQSRVQVLQRPYRDHPAGHCNTIITLECWNWSNWSGQGLTTFGTNKFHSRKLWGYIYPKLMMHIKYLVITNQVWVVFCS